jgi:intracellular sulfur oxidation DsrE/DsrF family protein
MSDPIVSRRKVLIASATAGAATLAVAGAARAATDPKAAVHVVYHITRGNAQASRALANVRNHLAADPGAKIVVVGNGAGIDFLLNGAKDANGAEYAGNVGDLASRGVSFRVCENTLSNRKISKDQVLLDATTVPSGVVEAATLQYREAYAYISP